MTEKYYQPKKVIINPKSGEYILNDVEYLIVGKNVIWVLINFLELKIKRLLNEFPFEVWSKENFEIDRLWYYIRTRKKEQNYF